MKTLNASKIIISFTLTLLYSFTVLGMSCPMLLGGKKEPIIIEIDEDVRIVDVLNNIKIGLSDNSSVIGHRNEAYRNAFFSAVAIGMPPGLVIKNLSSGLEHINGLRYTKYTEEAFLTALAMGEDPAYIKKNLDSSKQSFLFHKKGALLAYHIVVGLDGDAKAFAEKILNAPYVETAYGKAYENAFYMGLLFDKPVVEIERALNEALLYKDRLPPALLQSFYFAAVFLEVEKPVEVYEI